MAMGNYHISFTFILLLIRMINNLIVKKKSEKTGESLSVLESAVT